MALYYHNVVVVYYTIISDISLTHNTKLTSEKHSGNLTENHPLLLFILGGFLLLELHRRDLPRLYIMILFEN